MARDYHINGETMVYVKNAALGNVQQLGLAEGPITIGLDLRHADINVDAWGPDMPAELQANLAGANISMNLIHYDRTILQSCLMQSMGGAPTWGTTGRAGQRMGNNLASNAAGHYFIRLTLASPVDGLPWRFLYTVLTGQPISYPVGTQKSVVQVNWRAIPYTQDPWNAGLGAYGTVIWDNGSDA